MKYITQLYHPKSTYLLFIWCFLAVPLHLFSQNTNVSVNFNTPNPSGQNGLPNGWTAQLSDPDGVAVWGVGISDNPEAGEVTSINGTPMLYFDDDAAGDGTAPWRVEILTPTFDATPNCLLTIEADIHFRNADSSAYLLLEAFDGTTYQTIYRFQGSEFWWNEFTIFRRYAFDVSAYINPNMHFRITYDDGGIWAWWAAIDNMTLVGTGDGPCTHLAQANFDDCSLPTGWTTNIIEGTNDWLFERPPPDYGGDINGTCMAYFNDDVLGDNVLATVQLQSPTFSTIPYATITLDLDVHFTDADGAELNDALRILAFDGNTYQTVFSFQDQHYTDWGIQNFTHSTFDLSPYRNPNFHVIIEYTDGGGWAWFAGVDNINIAGSGQAIDVCTSSQTLTIGEACTTNTNAAAFFDGPQPSCNDTTNYSLWYDFVAPASGSITINSNADFNDVITVFSGSCNNLTEIACYNYDEYGFDGENYYLNGLNSGQNYYLRLSGATCTFGSPTGTACVEINDGGHAKAPPINDLCTHATVLTVDHNCVSGTNIHATFNGPTPSLNERSRASIWYSFTAPTDGRVEINTNADFADVITVFSGNCNGLNEVVGTDFGPVLMADELTPNQTYYIQVSGYFATVEGNVCMALKNVPAAPTNDLCVDAMTIAIGEECSSSTNSYATFNGPTPSCDVLPNNSVWFRFTAPASGTVKMNSGADFVHVLSLYAGSCGNLSEMGCQYNPSKCDAAVAFNNLMPNEIYYVQVASAQNTFGHNDGEVCLNIQDNALLPVKAKVKVFLEGAYLGNEQMRTFLQDSNSIPLDQPYTNTPWQYSGKECVLAYPANMVDWVTLELRTADQTIVERKSAILLANGNVVDNGNDGVLFDKAIENNSYYLVVRHRNHLAIMSTNPVPLPNMNTYDFSQGDNFALGENQLKEVETGVFALHAGDFNGDGVITVGDFNFFRSQLAQSGYFAGDCTLDNTVSVDDFNEYRNNASVIGVAQLRY